MRMQSVWCCCRCNISTGVVVGSSRQHSGTESFQMLDGLLSMKCSMKPQWIAQWQCYCLLMWHCSWRKTWCSSILVQYTRFVQFGCLLLLFFVLALGMIVNATNLNDSLPYDKMIRSYVQQWCIETDLTNLLKHQTRCYVPTTGIVCASTGSHFIVRFVPRGSSATIRSL